MIADPRYHTVKLAPHSAPSRTESLEAEAPFDRLDPTHRLFSVTCLPADTPVFGGSSAASVSPHALLAALSSILNSRPVADEQSRQPTLLSLVLANENKNKRSFSRHRIIPAFRRGRRLSGWQRLKLWRICHRCGVLECSEKSSKNRVNKHNCKQTAHSFALSFYRWTIEHCWVSSWSCLRLKTRSKLLTLWEDSDNNADHIIGDHIIGDQAREC